MKNRTKLLLLLPLFFALLLACKTAVGPSTPAGCGSTAATKKAMSPGIKADVRIGVDVCAEETGGVQGSGELATLDCTMPSGTFRIFFPRKEWQDMKRDSVGVVDAGPGK